LSLSIVILGLGQVGWHLAQVLSRESHDIVAIDSNPVLCREGDEALDVKVIQGQGSDRRVLEEAGIERADMLIAATGNDETNVLACGLAARYGVKQKIARIRNPAFFDNPPRFSLADWGVDLAIQPEVETAKEIVLLVKRSAATDVLEFADGRIQLIGVRLDASCPLLHKSLEAVSREFPDKAFRVVAIQRGAETIIPGGHDILENRDQLFVVVSAGDVPRRHRAAREIRRETGARSMVSAGGPPHRRRPPGSSRREDLSIKLIEPDSERALAWPEAAPTWSSRGGRDFDVLAPRASWRPTPW